MAAQNNIPNKISIPGSLIGRHEESLISPMGTAGFSTRMKSDIAPMSTLSFATRMKSDYEPMSTLSFTTRMKSDIFPMSTLSFSSNMKSDIAPITLTGEGRHDKSIIAPINSTLGGNNENSNIAPINSTLGANNEKSDASPIDSTLSGRHESSAIDDASTTSDGRHESSAIDDGATTSDGRHESSGIDDGATTSDGRHESSGIDDALTTPDGRHESSNIDITTPSNVIDIPNSAATGFTPFTPMLESMYQGISGAEYTYPDTKGQGLGILGTANWLVDTYALGFILNKEPLQTDFTPAGLEYSPYPGSPAPSLIDTRHESSDFANTAVNFLDDSHALGFILNKEPLQTDFTSTALDYSPYPGSPAPSLFDGRHLSSLIDDTSGVDFFSNSDATGFTIQAQKYNTQFVGAVDDVYTYPDSQGVGAGLIDTSQGVNFLDIDNLDAQGFTTFFDSGIGTQFKGAAEDAGEYTYPDSHGLGLGLIGSNLFTNPYPTPYTSLLSPDGFLENHPVEESQFSIDSFAGGGPLGLGTEFTHATFGGVQGQVPIMGNNPTGLGQFLEGGETSGDIGIVDAFDDITSGATGFTPNMFDLGLPKTQFNGVGGTPGALTYDYPVEVGPDGTGRLMYNTPFSDAGNPYGGSYVSHLAAQIPVNPKITINKGARTDLAEYSLYKSEPSGLTGIVDTDPARPFFSEGNKYSDIISNFTTDIMINDTHPGSFLGDFASREGSPTPLDAMEVLIPANTGPTGEPDDTAQYTHVEGYPNYNTHNLSYSAAEVANQRKGFERNELISRHGDYDYNKSALYGHDITFGGQGDDPNGLKMYKEPHILRDMDTNWGLFGGFDEGAFRGGFLTLGNRALKDVVRNVKHIIEDPIKGLLWGLKQVGLQASNPKVETEMFFLGRRTRVFNLGIGMIANMLTGPFGIKLYRHGLLNGILEGDATYEKAVKAHGGINPYDPDKGQGIGKDTVGKGGGNRLAQLQRELLHFGGTDLAKSTAVTAGLPYSYKGEKIKLLSGIAGPKSLYGIGQTRIRRWEKTDSHMTGDRIAQQIPETVGGGRSSLLAKYASLDHIGLDIAAELKMGNALSTMDFRIPVDKQVKKDPDKLYLGDTESFPYEKFNREAKFGYRNYAGDRDRSEIPKTFSHDDKPEFWKPDGLADYLDFNEAYGTDVVDDIEGYGRDMIKLIIHDIPQDKFIRMRAYLTDMVDTISPEWSNTNYIGRPDGVHSYKSTTRSFACTLKFAALSQTGMTAMYRKVNYLMGLAYPHLAKGLPNEAISETMVAPLIKLTIGDWLHKCPGYFTSMAYTIDNDFPWEINLQNDPQVAQLPMVLSVGLEFVVIGDGPHMSAIETIGEGKIAGTHIGGGVSAATAKDKFFEGLPIQTEEK